MDLLTNAVESIRLGVEDFEVGSHPRLISAVRNIHAGILLLFKEALRRMSPDGSNEALVKAKIEPVLDDDGEVVFVGKGTKTADTQQIKERFENLEIVTDWKQFDVIAKARNDVEHYYPKLNQQALNGVVASAFSIVRDFVTDELDAEPRELLGEPTWQAMLKVAAVYSAEKKLCDDSVEKAEWSAQVVKQGLVDVACSACGSDLLEAGQKSQSWSGPVLVCRACGSEMEPTEFAPTAVRSALSREMYVAVKDGEEEPYTDCPHCHSEASYLVSEQECVVCGESAEHTCSMCGNGIPVSELSDGSLCGYCDHMMHKDD